MITLGADFGGPEDTAFQEAWMRVANAIGEACGEAEEWEGTVPGVNVVFYVPGSVMDHVSVTKIEAARFSRKRKLLLVNVPVPKEIVRDWNQSLLFLIDALCKANAIAAEVFGHKKGMEPFDLAKAEAIIDRVKEMLVEPENRDGLPQGG